ncbi:MAG: hypothetical protein ACJ77A_05130 [Actinomycetota bacterium]
MARSPVGRGSVCRRVAVGAAVAALAVGPAATARAEQGTTTVKLPTATDAIAVAINIERVLNGPGGVETRLPGPVADAERVRVGFDLDGSPARVVDDQQLDLSGVGDFEFKIPGPASDVAALPGSESEPGLRRGSVLWQGFCSGTKSLGARLDLIPGQEEVRLPIRVALSMTVDGKPVEPGPPVSGELHLRMIVTNNSAVPIQVVDGTVDPARGAAVLDAIRDDLRAGRRPSPGTGGVPGSIEVSGATFRTVRLEAPSRVRGSIDLTARALHLERTSGVSGVAPAGTVAFDAVLGGGRPLRHTVELTARVRDLRLPAIGLSVEPALPSPQVLAPPTSSTWERGVRTAPGTFDGRRMAALILDTMWRTARLRQFDAYLGNPDPTGPAHTTYAFELSPPPRVAAAPPVPASDHGPLGTVAVAAVALLLLLGAVVAWSRS